MKDHIAAFADRGEQTKFISKYILALERDRHDYAFHTRHRYRTPSILKELYLLALRHIRREDDIQRPSGECYSPGPQDEAQDARDGLFRHLSEIDGKETFLAMSELAEEHPDKTSRPWQRQRVHARAQEASDLVEWPVTTVREFQDDIERTPKNHRELFDLARLRLDDLRADLEDGDSSDAPMLRKVASETDVRKYIGNWLRQHARGRYTVPQEEEFADAKRPDLRFQGCGFDAPVPVELKLADNWSGPDLFERLENQLCGDYLRDDHSSCGIFALVYRGEKSFWGIDGERLKFEQLLTTLSKHWEGLSPKFFGVEDIRIVGIDLTRRAG